MSRLASRPAAVPRNDTPSSILVSTYAICGSMAFDARGWCSSRVLPLRDVTFSIK